MMDVETLKLLIDKEYYNISSSFNSLENIAQKISLPHFMKRLSWEEAEKLENELENGGTYPYDEAYQYLKNLVNGILEDIEELNSALEILESS